MFHVESSRSVPEEGSKSYHRRAGSLDSDRASQDSLRTGRTRASTASKSSRGTVQDLMAFAEHNPFEFEQAILLLRLTDTVKAETEDRIRTRSPQRNL